jgi:hypothetical protein
VVIDYIIPSIPTIYNSRRYRSRLEARWAAYFDILGLDHEYEPSDLGGWSPDFLIRTSGIPVLAEVKPIVEPDEDTCLRMVENAKKAKFSGSLLLLGVSPFKATETPHSAIAIGWIGTIAGDWFEGIFSTYLGNLDIMGCTPVQEIAYVWDESADYISGPSMLRAWATASNVVQWRGRNS